MRLRVPAWGAGLVSAFRAGFLIWSPCLVDWFGLVSLEGFVMSAFVSSSFVDSALAAASVDYGRVTLVDVLASEVAEGCDWDAAGGSVAVSGGVVPASGFVVGGVCDSLVVEADSLAFGSVFGLVRSWLDSVAGALVDADLVGWWLDEVSGLVYFDLSTVVDSETEARALGVARREIALWDLGAGAEVRL